MYTATLPVPPRGTVKVVMGTPVTGSANWYVKFPVTY
jgi:hypothetical protein